MNTIFQRFLTLAAIIFLAASADTLCQTTPNYAEQARDASNNGKHDEAAVLYTKALELSQYDALYSLRALEYEELGKFDLALADRTKVIELDRSSPEKALERRARLLVHMGKYDLGAADYTKALSIRPSRARLYNYRAEAYLIMGKPDLAYADFIAFLNSGNTDDGNLANAIHDAYLSLRKSGKTDEAKKFIAEAAPQYDQTRFEGKIARFLNGDLTAAQLISDPNGDPAWAHFYVGEMLLLGGDAAAAAEHFKFARENAPKFSFAYEMAVAEIGRLPAPKSTARRNAEVLTANGRQLRDKGDLNGSIASYARAIEIDPTYFYAYFERGNTYGFFLSNYPAALADYGQVLRLEPNDRMTLCNRSVIYLAVGELAKAFADADMAVSLKPDDAGTYLYRARALLRQAKFDLAIADYSKAISLDPKDPWHVRSRGFAEYVAGQYAAAYKDSAAALTMGMTKEFDGGQGAVVIGYLALLRQGKRAEADAFVANSLQSLKANLWSTGVINYINGVVTAEQLFAEPDTDHRQTRYRTYIAEILLANGKPDAAKPHLIWVYQAFDRVPDEYLLATLEIARLALKK